MSKAPAMPMYWDAYIADTTHLTIEEHGAYMMLLGAMWRRDGSIPNDDKDIARILGVTVSKWKKIKRRLSDFLTIEADKISQEKLQKVWEKTQEKIAKNSVNGSKGGRPKVNKNNGLKKADGFNSLNPNESIPEPEPEPYKKGTNVPQKNGVDRKAEIEHFRTAWNEFAKEMGLAQVKSINKTRSSQLLARIKSAGGVSNLTQILHATSEIDWLMGRTKGRDWRMDFDYFIQESGFIKISEQVEQIKTQGPIRQKPKRSFLDEYADQVEASQQPRLPQVTHDPT